MSGHISNLVKRADSPVVSAGKALQQWVAKQDPAVVFYVVFFSCLVSSLIQLYILYLFLRRCKRSPAGKGWQEIERQREVHVPGSFYQPSQPYDPTPTHQLPATLRPPSSVGHVPSIIFHSPNASSVASQNRYSQSLAAESQFSGSETMHTDAVPTSPLVLPPPPHAPPIMRAATFSAPVFDAAFELKELENEEAAKPQPVRSASAPGTIEQAPVPSSDALPAASTNTGNVPAPPSPRPTHTKKASSGAFVPKTLTLAASTSGSPPLNAGSPPVGSDGSWEHTKIDEKPPQLDLKSTVGDWTINTWQASVNLGRKISLKATPDKKEEAKVNDESKAS